MVGAGLPIVPPIFRRLARLAGVGRSDPATAAAMANLEWRSLAEGVAAMTLAWALLGTSLWAVLRAMDVPDVNLVAQMPLYVARCVRSATVAGFLSLIPGGALVRELILAELVAPRFGDVVAVVSAVFPAAGVAGGRVGDFGDSVLHPARPRCGLSVQIVF